MATVSVWAFAGDDGSPQAVTEGVGSFSTDRAYVVLNAAAEPKLYLWVGESAEQLFAEFRVVAPTHEAAAEEHAAEAAPAGAAAAESSKAEGGVAAAGAADAEEAPAAPAAGGGAPAPSPSKENNNKGAGAAAAGDAAPTAEVGADAADVPAAAAPTTAAPAAAAPAAAAPAASSPPKQQEEKKKAKEAPLPAKPASPAAPPAASPTAAPAASPAGAPAAAAKGASPASAGKQAKSPAAGPAPAPAGAKPASPAAPAPVAAPAAAPAPGPKPAPKDSSPAPPEGDGSAAKTYLSEAAKAWGGAAAAAAAAHPVAEVTVKPGDKTFPYAQLKDLRSEDGIDPARKEDYLADEEFAKVFGKPRAEWKAQPAWRQQLAKKQVGLCGTAPFVIVFCSRSVAAAPSAGF
eukprot:scaffold1.g5785.t1